MVYSMIFSCVLGVGLGIHRHLFETSAKTSLAEAAREFSRVPLNGKVLERPRDRREHTYSIHY